MREKEILKSQYYASLEMLRKAIEQCPVELWQDPQARNQFWHVAYHAIFYTHFYLHTTEADYVPWEKHRDEIVSLQDSLPEGKEIPTQEEVRAYLQFCLAEMDGLVDALDLEAESGFYWLPFDKLELQVYNIRHIMQHTGELYDRLGAAGIEIPWVGMKPMK